VLCCERVGWGRLAAEPDAPFTRYAMLTVSMQKNTLTLSTRNICYVVPVMSQVSYKWKQYNKRAAIHQQMPLTRDSAATAARTDARPPPRCCTPPRPNRTCPLVRRSVGQDIASHHIASHHAAVSCSVCRPLLGWGGKCCCCERELRLAGAAI